MRICIDMGHTPASPGAGGCFDELTYDRQLGERVISELERRGHTVYNSTPPDTMAYPDEVGYRSSYANARDIDIFCSIHFNAANGSAHGTEVLYQSWSDDAYAYAERMSELVSNALGTYNRGPKPRTGEIGVIRDTKATAILVETCFCDNDSDAEKWFDCPWNTIVNAVCDGIDGGEYEEGDDDVMASKEEVADAILCYKSSGDMEFKFWGDDVYQDIWNAGHLLTYKNEKVNGTKDLYQLITDAAKAKSEVTSLTKKVASLESKIDAILEKMQ